MTNLEKYNNAFIEALEITENELTGLKYQEISSWDSIGHMNLIAELEDALEIEMEADDVIAFSSYEKGKEIVAKYGIVL